MKDVGIRTVVLAVAAGLALVATPAAAQSTSLAGAAEVSTDQATLAVEVRDEIERLRKELDALRQEYERRIGTLEQRLGALSGPSAVERPAAGEPAPATQAQAYSNSSTVFNPNISAVGNFIALAGDNPESPDPSLQLTEAEVAFQAVVDPYAKADFFLSAGPDGVEIEEGYVTFTTLPAGLLLKAGKMRAQFGKVNTMHTHILPWADRPLVMQNLMGGDEGLSDAGFSVSRLIPNNFMFLEATGEVFRGDSEVFQTDERSRLVYLGRLRGYRDLTDDTNVDLGVSFTHGPTDVGADLDKRLVGVDATLRWRPLRRAIYRRFVWRTEFVWSRQDRPLNPIGPGPAVLRQAFGFYSSADYQFARRWYIGARVDRSGRVLDAALTDSGGSVYLTFWPSEFSQVRGQYRRTAYAEGVTANELLFQLNFSIGAHGAHVF